VLEQLVQHYLGLDIAPDFNDDAKPLLLVASSRRSVTPAPSCPAPGRDALNELSFVDLVGDLVDDDSLLAALLFLNAGPCLRVRIRGLWYTGLYASSRL
jgi:hypothetical protein